jgi:hypothetical protein
MRAWRTRRRLWPKGVPPGPVVYSPCPASPWPDPTQGAGWSAARHQLRGALSASSKEWAWTANPSWSGGGSPIRAAGLRWPLASSAVQWTPRAERWEPAGCRARREAQAAAAGQPHSAGTSAPARAWVWLGAEQPSARAVLQAFVALRPRKPRTSEAARRTNSLPGPHANRTGRARSWRAGQSPADRPSVSAASVLFPNSQARVTYGCTLPESSAKASIYSSASRRRVPHCLRRGGLAPRCAVRQNALQLSWMGAGDGPSVRPDLCGAHPCGCRFAPGV